MSRYLILGGVRSGKSALAEQIAAKLGETATVHYVATAQAGDGEMSDRIQAHQARRPEHWGLVEEPLALASVLEQWDRPDQVLLVDCMSLWLSNLLMAGPEVLAREREAFLQGLADFPGSLVIVSNEVGMGLIGMNALSRQFADELGWLNQALAQRSEQVYFCAAGLPLVLKGEGEAGP